MGRKNVNMERTVDIGALKAFFTPRRILVCFFGLVLLAGAFLLVGALDSGGSGNGRLSGVAADGYCSIAGADGLFGEGVLVVNRGGAVKFLRGIARRCSPQAAPPADPAAGPTATTLLLLCFSLYFANLVVIKSKPVILSDIQGGAASVRAAPRF